MAKIVLQDVSNTPNMYVGVNNNSDRIEAAFENTLSRDGTGPNHMNADLDMNGYNLLNVGNPVKVEGIEWKGVWASAFDYKIGNIVTHASGTYIAIQDHTSGDFDTDLINNKWQLFVQVASPFIDITDYGAIGDGVTNNFQAITDAMAAANGRKIVVPVDAAGGDYAVTSGSLTLTGVFEYETGARIYANGGTVTDNSRYIVFGGGATGETGASRFTRGIEVALNAGNSGSPSVGEVAFNRIFIKNDTVDATTGSGTKTYGLMVHKSFGGAGAKGGRHAIHGILTQNGITETGSPDRNYVGTVGVVTSGVGDGGGVGSEKGAYFGMNAFAALKSGATHTVNISSCEFNSGIYTGASSLYRSGIQIAGFGDVRGSNYDAGVSISNLGTATTTWKHGILVGSQNGSNALGTDSTAIAITQSGSINNALEITSPVTNIFTYSSGGAVVRLSPTSFQANSSGFGFEIGSSTSVNTPYLDFHSSGVNQDYDSRILASGGSAGIGSGTLTYTAAQHTFTGRINPSSTAGIRGTITNDDAQAGSVGEVISAQVLEANKVALTTNIPLTVMQITLTPGHWDLKGQGAMYCANSTTTTRFGFSFSTTTNVIDLNNFWYNATMGTFTTGSAGTFLQASHISTPIKLSTTTTYYMVFITGFTAGAVSAYGSMFATRVR